FFFFFSSRRRHTRFSRDWSSDVCSSDLETLPEAPFYYNHEAKAGERAAITFALSWLPDGGTPIQESYVNLIPTAQGGTHVNGLRSEERRVGKECRCRCVPDHCSKNRDSV